MSSSAKKRGAGFKLRSNRQNLVEAPANHDGPHFPDEDKEARGFKGGADERKGVLQTLFWPGAPFNRGRGEGLDGDEHYAPSLWTAVVAFIMIFLACLSFGWLYTLTLNHVLNGPESQSTQAIFLGIVAFAFFVVTMNMTWEPTMPTLVFWSMSTTSVGTFDLGLPAWFGYSIVQFGGWAAGGAIAKAMATINVLVISPGLSTAGIVIYWFGGAMICFLYMLVRKFELRDHNDESRSARYRRAIWYAGFVLLAFTVAFRPPLGLFYFDALPYLAMVVATGGNNTQWPYYIFLPLASAATAWVLYLGVTAGMWGSDVWDKKQPKIEQAGYRYVAPRFASRSADLNVYN